MSTAKPIPMALDQMRALIVGGTSSVGLETARQLLEVGNRSVAIVGRNAARGERAVEKLGKPAGLHLIAGDAATCHGAQQIAAAASIALGGIDLLVCATASPVTPELFDRISPDAIGAVLTGLALPTMLVASAVLPRMTVQQRGVIVNIASDAGRIATPGATTIGAAMAAVIMFSRTLAMEAKRDGVRVNAVAPSLIAETDSSHRVLAAGFSAQLFRKAIRRADLGVVAVEDVAALVLFLASPAARRVTGQVISVNGGISAA